MTDQNESNKIYLFADSIDYEFAGKIIKEIDSKIQKFDELDIIICSSGGNFYSSWAIKECICNINFNNHSKKINTYCLGYVGSSAFFIFLAGHNRMCTKGSIFCFHEIYSDFGEGSRPNTFYKHHLQNDILYQKMINDFMIAQTCPEIKSYIDESIREKKDIEFGYDLAKRLKIITE
jgi:ATP-dependent protease ClpP protease subunit